MATANPSRPLPPRRRRPLWPAVVLAAMVVASIVLLRPIRGFAAVGTAYGAHVACSCRYAGGRSLGDCKKDFEPGMELVSLSEDAAHKSVTASFPLIKSTTATYREGWGCVLEPARR